MDRSRRENAGRRVSGKRLEQTSLSGGPPMKRPRNRIIVPKFATEAEEADWWFKNRHIHDKQMLAAVKSGEARS
jgi:hypothetical protein